MDMYMYCLSFLLSTTFVASIPLLTTSILDETATQFLGENTSEQIESTPSMPRETTVTPTTTSTTLKPTTISTTVKSTTASTPPHITKGPCSSNTEQRIDICLYEFDQQWAQYISPQRGMPRTEPQRQIMCR